MNRKILVVDDHFIVRSGMTLLFENELEGSQVFVAEDFPGALDQLRKDFFDLVILDINLPGGKKIQMKAAHDLGKNFHPSEWSEP